jgi:hypothetical protein
MDINILNLISTIIISAIVALVTIMLKVGKYQQKVDDLKEEKDKNSFKIDSLRTDVDTLKEFKTNAQKFIDKELYKSKSPLTLTDLGLKLVRDSGFERVFDSEKDNLASMLAERQPDTQYDVQEKARAVMDELTEYTAFESIKTFAFKNGQDLGQILRAGAILLRDYYLDKHPEIKE